MIILGEVLVPVDVHELLGGHEVGQRDARRRGLLLVALDLLEGGLRHASEEVHRELVDVVCWPLRRRALLLRAVPGYVPGLAAAVAQAVLQRYSRPSTHAREVSASAVATLDIA